MPEDYRSPEKVSDPVKQVREGFLKEEVFELGRKLGGGETEDNTLEAEGKRMG